MLTLEGDKLDFGTVESAIDGFGASIHSVDQVSCGTVIVEDHPTLQDV